MEQDDCRQAISSRARQAKLARDCDWFAFLATGQEILIRQRHRLKRVNLHTRGLRQWGLRRCFLGLFRRGSRFSGGFRFLAAAGKHQPQHCCD
jgi:hypothetical protein